MIERARRFLLDRLSSAATLLLAILLRLREVPTWADGTDAEGRAVFLVGRHALGDTDAAQEAIHAVLTSLRAGEVPEGIHAIAYAPKASAAIAEVVAGTAAEILIDGPRGSGKTQDVPAALATLAELHARAGYSLPLIVLWLHDSLTNAALKTGRSVEQRCGRASGGCKMIGGKPSSVSPGWSWSRPPSSAHATRPPRSASARPGRGRARAEPGRGGRN